MHTWLARLHIALVMSYRSRLGSETYVHGERELLLQLGRRVYVHVTNYVLQVAWSAGLCP